MRHYLLFLIVLFFIPSCSPETSEVVIEKDAKLIEDVFNFADKQLRYALHCVDSARTDDEYLPLAVDHKSGQLVMGNAYSWRAGFFAGNLWQMYEYENSDFFKNQAIRYTELIEETKTYSQHDLGVMFNNSFGKAYSFTNQDHYRDVLITAANTLLSRYNAKIGCIKSWDSSSRWTCPVIIDNMMNLELLFVTTQLTGDSTYYKVAISHAEHTLINHFRQDFSSYHVVDYNPETGAVNKKVTYQGYSDESYWSRGQAWGLYGFTMCYRYTHNPIFLHQAQKIAEFLLGLKYADDAIPYWDMLCPDIPNTVRDASSASIMASALIELSHYCNDKNRGTLLAYSKKLLMSLHDYYQSKVGENFGFLLLHSTTSVPYDVEVDVPLVYADYYYLEALLRLKNYNNNF